MKRVYACGRQIEPPLLAHVVNFPRLEIPLSGCYQNQIEVDRRPTTVRLSPGTALFAPPNCWNLPTWRRGLRLMSILFGKKQIGISIVTTEQRSGFHLKARKFSLPRPLTGPLPRILDAMVEVQAAGGPTAVLPQLAQALLCCLEDSLEHPAAQPVNRVKTLFEDVCVFLQGHYQYDITRDSVARQFAISPNYLSRIFEQQGHMTFSSYLMHVRMDRAKHLLRSYNLKLDEVAARCGYHETAYFCRLFKRLAKCTPVEYRTQYRSNGPAFADRPQ